MASKSEKKPKLSDYERHERFVDMAREIEASEDANDFDKAFDKITQVPPVAQSTSRKTE